MSLISIKVKASIPPSGYPTREILSNGDSAIIVIDAPIFDLPNGDKLELASFAKKIASSSNSKIKDKKYHFQVNNTNTASTSLSTRSREDHSPTTPFTSNTKHLWRWNQQRTALYPRPSDF